MRKRKTLKKRNKSIKGGKSHNKSYKSRKGHKKTRKVLNPQKKSFVKLNCSPENHNKALNSFTCYSDEDLHKLRDIWNARHPDKPIQTNDSKEIWETIKIHYQTTCNKESCWIKQMVKNSKLE